VEAFRTTAKIVITSVKDFYQQ